MAKTTKKKTAKKATAKKKPAAKKKAAKKKAAKKSAKKAVKKSAKKSAKRKSGKKKAAKKKAAKKSGKKKSGKKKAGKKKAGKKKAAKQSGKKKAAKQSGKKKAAKSGAKKTIEGYIGKLGDWRADVVQAIGRIVKAVAPQATSSIKWAQPVFEHNGPFAYVKAHAKHVNFGFWRGKQLDDPEGSLESGGERMAHVKIHDKKDVDERTFGEWIRQAVALNSKDGDPTKR